MISEDGNETEDDFESVIDKDELEFEAEWVDSEKGGTEQDDRESLSELVEDREHDFKTDTEFDVDCWRKTKSSSTLPETEFVLFSNNRERECGERACKVDFEEHELHKVLGEGHVSLEAESDLRGELESELNGEFGNDLKGKFAFESDSKSGVEMESRGGFVEGTYE